jgi:hypothetical protein
MVKYEWKKGDKLKVIHPSNPLYLGEIVTADEDVYSDNDYRTTYIILSNGIRDYFNHRRFELIKQEEPNKTGDTKVESEDDLVRYMAFGTGCKNKGNVVLSEKDLKAEMEKYSTTTNWTGRIIGYKLIPLYEAERRTLFRPFKLAKRGRGRPRKV